MNDEKRQYERYAVSLEVELKTGKEESPVRTGTTVNFSRAGMCLQISDPVLTLRGAVDLQVKMPEGNAVTPAAGDIVWSRGDHEKCCYGIKIIAMNKADKFLILDYCRRTRPEEPHGHFPVN